VEESSGGSILNITIEFKYSARIIAELQESLLHLQHCKNHCFWPPCAGGRSPESCSDDFPSPAAGKQHAGQAPCSLCSMAQCLHFCWPSASKSMLTPKPKYKNLTPPHPEQQGLWGSKCSETAGHLAVQQREMTPTFLGDKT